MCTCVSMQHYSFYDFIINKARGKSGPLFSFDVHEDVRLVTDANVEKDEVWSLPPLPPPWISPPSPRPAVPRREGGTEELVRAE